MYIIVFREGTLSVSSGFVFQAARPLTGHDSSISAEHLTRKMFVGGLSS